MPVGVVKTTPGQYAAALKKLMDQPSMTVVELARKIGRSEKWTTNHLNTTEEVKPDAIVNRLPD